MIETDARVTLLLFWGFDMRALVLIVGLISSPALASDQFDLVCKGNKSTAEHYRVDLSRGEWCFGRCEFVQKIASVTAGLLVFAEHQPDHSGDHTSYNRVNRITGEWEWYYREPGSNAQDIRGVCEAVPFTAMPTAKF